MEKLKPCPFCGGEAKIYEGFREVPVYFPECTKCGASFIGYFEIKESAIKEWNTRVERTCKMERDKDGKWHCLECNTTLESWYDSWAPNYCPNCGTKVVEE